MIEKLEALGLTLREAAVYVALIENGDATADTVAKMAKFNRSTTYVQISSLQEMGLVTTYKRGKKTYYAAESPNNLERLIEKKYDAIEHQKSEARMLVPELLKIYGQKIERPTVRVFEGKDGLVAMRHEMLDGSPKLIQVIYSYDAMAKIYTEEELLAFSKKRSAKKIQSEGLYTKTGEDIISIAPQKLKRLNSKEFPFDSDIYIYGDTVSYASTKDKIVGITIKNANIAFTMRTMFEVLWKQSK